MSDDLSVQCDAKVPSNNVFHSARRCVNMAGPSGLCGIHDPEAKAARKQKRGPTRFESELARIKVRSDVLDAARAMVLTDTLADMRDAQEVLRKALALYDAPTIVR